MKTIEILRSRYKDYHLLTCSGKSTGPASDSLVKALMQEVESLHARLDKYDVLVEAASIVASTHIVWADVAPLRAALKEIENE